MSDVAIRVEGLGKRYRIGERERYYALRDTLSRAVRAPWRMLRGGASEKAERPEIWALKDVSFEVKRGEVVGVIGRNGAGKSTLLKVLSRITEPTRGFAELHGRIGSLLEVGTGFHPELTGRENVYLNGAILGMKRHEMRRRFDEIVSFAEVEEFIDTPVKYYSSGMHLRLAFSVAAHLEPEIIVVDEVLAVGDTAFQKKCLSSVGDMGEAGRTVILVSHQLNQLRRLCQRCIWLDAGTIVMIGSTEEILASYQAASSSRGDSRTASRTSRSAGFLRWQVQCANEAGPHEIGRLGPVRVAFRIRLRKSVRHGHHGVALYDSGHQLLWGTAHDHLRLDEGVHDLVHEFPALPLRPGVYSWRASFYDENGLIDDWTFPDLLRVTVEPFGHARDEWAGILNFPTQFEVRSMTGAPA